MCNGRCWRRHNEDITGKKSDVCLCAPNSDDMDFFQKLSSAGPQVGNYEAIGQVWLKNYNSKWAKKYRQNGSSVDDTRSPRVKRHFAEKMKLGPVS